MPDESTKSAFQEAGVWLGGGGALAALGVLLRGIFTGAVGQEKEVRDTLAQENKRLRKLANLSLDWKSRCLDARQEAERLGYDRAKWPPDPEDDAEDE